MTLNCRLPALPRHTERSAGRGRQGAAVPRQSQRGSAPRPVPAGAVPGAARREPRGGKALEQHPQECSNKNPPVIVFSWTILTLLKPKAL